MKKTSLSLLLFLTLNVYAQNEFPYIQPVSVELAPVVEVKAIESQPPQVIQAPKKIEKMNTQKIEKDSDNDGVVDSKDQCPNTPAGFVVNDKGCPTTKILHIVFAANESKIPDSSMKEIKEFAEFLKQNDQYDVVILGYTDTSGNPQTNIELSQKRADALKRALVDYGIVSARFTAIGKGSQNPIADNATAEGRAQNRRIEMQLVE